MHPQPPGTPILKLVHSCFANPEKKIILTILVIIELPQLPTDVHLTLSIHKKQWGKAEVGETQESTQDNIALGQSQEWRPSGEDKPHGYRNMGLVHTCFGLFIFTTPKKKERKP